MHEELGLIFPLAQKGGDDMGNFYFHLTESMTSLKQLEPRYTKCVVPVMFTTCGEYCTPDVILTLLPVIISSIVKLQYC